MFLILFTIPGCSSSTLRKLARILAALPLVSSNGNRSPYLSRYSLEAASFSSVERLSQKLLILALISFLKEDGFKRFVLRQNYGDRVEKCFHMTRQGVRWRFQRLFNEIYTNAYETVFWMESNFGTELRPMALEIARERIALRKKASSKGYFDTCRRQNEQKGSQVESSRLTSDSPS